MKENEQEKIIEFFTEPFLQQELVEELHANAAVSKINVLN